MTTDNLPTNLEAILAAKRQFLMERRAKTPIAAVSALADMQRRPQPILNTVTNGSQVTLIGQITHSDTYDPVAATLRYIREGVDAVSLFTDQIVYRRGLDDLLLVSRGVNIPVISQDYILDEYHVVEARAAGASALVLSQVLDQPRSKGGVGDAALAHDGHRSGKRAGASAPTSART
jgi:indole-3-glycerol phosphate synthase